MPHPSGLLLAHVSARHGKSHRRFRCFFPGVYDSRYALNSVIDIWHSFGKYYRDPDRVYGIGLGGQPTQSTEPLTAHLQAGLTMCGLEGNKLASLRHGKPFSCSGPFESFGFKTYSLEAEGDIPLQSHCTRGRRALLVGESSAAASVTGAWRRLLASGTPFFSLNKVQG